MQVEIINVAHYKQLSFIGECAGISHGKPVLRKDVIKRLVELLDGAGEHE